MKLLLCCAVFVMLLSFADAQNDTLTNPLQDSATNVDAARTHDTLGINFPILATEEKRPIYKLRPGADIPTFAIGAGWSGYAFTKIYSKTPSTEEEILSLNKNDINAFDRWAVRPYSKSIDRISYYPFFASIPLPF